MSAPERIWAAPVTDSYGEWQTTTDGLPRPTEYTRSDLVAELAAENERLTADRDFWKERFQVETRARIEALASTGAVKALEWSEYETDGWADRADAEAGSFGVFYNIDIQPDGYRVVFDHEAVGAIGTFDTADEAKAAAQADYDRRILSEIEPHPRATNTVDAHETADMSDKPEGQQEPVAMKTHGAWDGLEGLDDLPDGTMLYTRPSEQTVTEAAMSEAEAMFADYFRRNYPGPDTIIGKPDWHSPKIFRAALHALRSIGALKAAMEVGG